jgi:hypothetical protein
LVTIIPSIASEADSKPETPTSLLEAQTQYAKAKQLAAQDMSKIAADKYLDTYGEVRWYKKFDVDVQNEFARANKMYLSLISQHDGVMEQLCQINMLPTREEETAVPRGIFMVLVTSSSCLS